jgi:hypothetical protein
LPHLEISALGGGGGGFVLGLIYGLTASSTQSGHVEKAAVYRTGDRATKNRILNELVDSTRWHRRYSRAGIRDTRPGRSDKPAQVQRAPRAPVYAPDMIAAGVRGRGPTRERGRY